MPDESAATAVRRVRHRAVRVMASLLAFDTSTERLHLGLALGDRVWLHDGPGGASASASLIGAVRALLAGAGVGPRDLDAFAFGCGPGAFTGLRTACAVAQGMAFGTGKPAVAIDTLMAMAEDVRVQEQVEDVWVAIDARVDEIYAARYRFADGAWQTVRKPALVSAPALCEVWQAEPPLAVAGNATEVFAGRLSAGGAPTFCEAAPRARALLACAESAFEQGLVLAPERALPLYVRNRVAQTSAERAVAHAEGAGR